MLREHQILAQIRKLKSYNYITMILNINKNSMSLSVAKQGGGDGCGPPRAALFGARQN